MGRLVAQIPNEDPARLARVQDAKWRTIGVDCGALQCQVGERQAKEAFDAQRDRDWAALAQHYDDMVCSQKQAADAAKRDIERQVLAFQQTRQGHHTGSEWDLNRPDRFLLASPARIGDHDARCGPSSIQKFDGEDLAAAERSQAQHQQCYDWWEAQRAQHEAQKAAQAEATLREQEAIRMQDAVQAAAAAEERRIRADNYRATLLANLQLAEARAARDAAERHSELMRSEAELSATLADPYLGEDPAMAASSLSAYRVRKDHWKGMSAMERSAIAQQQVQQVAEKKARQQQLLHEDWQYARSQADIARNMASQANQVELFKATMARKAANFLEGQMVEKAARDAQIAALYTNEPKPEYFRQFGTSHR
ncbi:hypothetical protein WJX77_005278 [Trebouxia sp. C0004]